MRLAVALLANCTGQLRFLQGVGVGERSPGRPFSQSNLLLFGLDKSGKGPLTSPLWCHNLFVNMDKRMLDSFLLLVSKIVFSPHEICIMDPSQAQQRDTPVHERLQSIRQQVESIDSRGCLQGSDAMLELKDILLNLLDVVDFLATKADCNSSANEAQARQPRAS